MTKFGKAWRKRYDALPTVLRERSIDYKRWKRHTDCATAVTQLARDAAVVERTLSSWTSSTTTRRRRCFCFFSSAAKTDDDDETGASTADVLAFVELNAAATRKICKRLSKRLRVPAAAWLAENRWRFSYCSAAHQAKLRMSVQGAGCCPVCLEEMAGAKVVITACGHVFCAGCTLRLAGVETTRGTLANVLSWARWYGRSFSCPMCRAHDPTRRVLLVHAAA